VNVAEMNLWERMGAAMLVGVRDPILKKTLGDEALALLDPESLLLLAAVIAVVLYGNAWGGPVAWAGTLATLVGLYFAGRDVISIANNFATFGKLAYDAKTEDDIKAAGREFAYALGRLGPQLLIALLTAGAFKAARAYIPQLRASMGKGAGSMPSKPLPPLEKPPALPVEKAPGLPVERAPAESPAAKPPSTLKKVATTIGDGGLGRPIAQASVGSVLIPLGVVAGAGLAVALLLRSRPQEVKVRVSAA